MKPTLLATTAAIFFLASTTSGAGPLHRYITELGRNTGYGISDGYHAQRYCLPACTTCSSCSPVQQPMMMQQPTMPQPMMPYPAMVPEYSQRTPPQFQQVRYPVGYYAVPMFQPQYQAYTPSYPQPTPVPAARPDRNSASIW